MDNQETWDNKVERIAQGLEEAYRKMIIFKRQKNSSVAVSIDGEVRKIDPHEMPSTITYRR